MVENNYPQAEGAPPSGKMPTWAWVLIGCGGAAVLLFMVLIIAAIAIPSLVSARSSSYETAAVGSCRAYAGAQVMYRKVNSTYANPYTKLFAPQDSTRCFIAKDFADAAGPTGFPKQGYLFQDMKTMGGKSIDWTIDMALCAKPAVYGKMGRRTFIVISDGTVYGKDLGPGGQFVDDYPANPAAAGWTIAE